MTPNYLKPNLVRFRKIHPQAADRVEKTHLTGKYLVTASKAGPMSLACLAPVGTRRTLHSAYDPHKEANLWLDSQWMEPSLNFTLTGLGLGYLLREWAARASLNSKILVFESDWEILKLALTHMDWTQVWDHPGIHWIVGDSMESLHQELEPFKLDYAINGYLDLYTPPLLKPESSSYQEIQNRFRSYFEEAQVHFNTQQAFSKTIYSNIVENMENIVSSPGIYGFKKLMQGKPIVVVSAGPSLDKNIHLLKQAESSAYLIAVPTALNTLLQNGISPDFIVAIDPTHISVDAFDRDNIPESTWLIFEPSIPACIPDAFGPRKIAIESNSPLYQWLNNFLDSKGHPGPASSVAHVALYLADLLGGNPIVLVGQDLAFDGERLHCSGVYYSTLNHLNAKQNLTPNHFNHVRYRDNASQMKPALDVFGNVSLTTQAMDSFKAIFSRETISQKLIFNATEGGIPIPGIQNVTLKEVLSSHCHPITGKREITPLSEKPLVGLASRFCEDISSLQELFRSWMEALIEIQEKDREGEVKSHSEPQSLPLQLSTLLHEFQKNLEAFSLLQGYLTEEFLQWNRTTYQLKLMQDQISMSDFEGKRHARDRTLIRQLIAGLHFLLESTEKLKRFGKDSGKVASEERPQTSPV